MEIACEMDFAETWVQELKIIYQQVSSWEETLFAWEDADAFPSEFIDRYSFSIEDEALQGLVRNKLIQVIRELKPKEQIVLGMRFGLDNKGERTLDEVGSYFNVTRERIRQIEAKALGKLRVSRRTKRLCDLLT